MEAEGNVISNDINRDLCSLRAILESDEDEEESNENELGESSEQQESHVSVLENLKLCLEKNLKLQSELIHLLNTTKGSLATNKQEQERLDQLLGHSHRCLPRTSISNYLRSWKPTKSKLSYFIDHKMEAPPPNQDAVHLARNTTVPDFHFISNEWLPNDTDKMKAGVKQKNIELLAEPIKKELSQPDTSLDKLRALQLEIRELRNLDETSLLKYSPEIDWEGLAYEQFGTDRTGNDCHLRYKNYEQPMISRSLWKKNEEKKLMKLVKENDSRNWEKIASDLGTNRSAIQCIAHYQQALNPDLLNRIWTKEEEERMQEAVKIYGTNWGLVATFVGNRTSVQCTNKNHARANIQQTSGRWQEDEDKRLHEAVEKFGHEGIVWVRIAGYVQTRTSTQCRERWKSVVVGKTLLRPWTREETEKIITYARKQIDDGESMLHWTEIGRELNRRDDDCRREWKKNAPHEDLMKYKTLRVKTLGCIKSKRSTSRKDTIVNDPTVQPKDIEDDMMSEVAKKQLSDYEQKLADKGKEKSPATKKPKSKKKKSKRSNSVQSSQNVTLPAQEDSNRVPSSVVPPSVIPPSVIPPSVAPIIIPLNLIPSVNLNTNPHPMNGPFIPRCSTHSLPYPQSPITPTSGFYPYNFVPSTPHMTGYYQSCAPWLSGVSPGQGGMLPGLSGTTGSSYNIPTRAIGYPISYCESNNIAAPSESLSNSSVVTSSSS